MGIFDTLYTGTSGLNAAQLQIQVTSQNITNSDSDYYIRQQVMQSAKEALHTVPGDIGMGTKVDMIVRVFDEFLFGKLTNSTTNKEGTAYKQQVLQEIAQRYPDLQDAGILKDLANYFNAWSDFASHPYEAAQKTNLVNATTTLTNNINNTADQLRAIHMNINEQIKLSVDEINRVAKQIADINRELMRIESTNQNQANDMRDQRDRLELTLANLMNISVFKNDILTNSQLGGTLTDQGRDYTLTIDGVTLVEGQTFNPIKLDTNGDANGFVSIYYELTDETRINMNSKIVNGKLGAMLDLRGREVNENGTMKDGIITEFRDHLDSFTKTLITQTNNIYASGATSSMSSNDLTKMQDNTTLQNYDSQIKNGSFDVVVYNKQGKEVGRKTINVDASTTMNDTRQGNSIISDFNADTDDNGDGNKNNDVNDYFTARYTYDEKTGLGHLNITPNQAEGEYYISIEDHGTNFAGVFGLSRFLDGSEAKNVSVNATLANNTSLVIGGKTPVVGDNSMANEMINLQYQKVDFHFASGATAHETLTGFYRFLTSDIASRAESINAAHTTNTTLYNAIYAQFQSTSGVDVSEELANLIRFQHSYGSAAKIISTTDQMLNTLLGIKQ